MAYLRLYPLQPTSPTHRYPLNTMYSANASHIYPKYIVFDPQQNILHLHYFPTTISTFNNYSHQHVNVRPGGMNW
jgi:hypothetical protein